MGFGLPEAIILHATKNNSFALERTSHFGACAVYISVRHGEAQR